MTKQATEGQALDMAEHERLWLTGTGAKMMGALGIGKGASVIDFGCGKGRYTIPLSQAVGGEGRVLAVERNGAEIDMLRRRMTAFRCGGKIEILSEDDMELRAADDHTVDALLAFDVLQFVDDWTRLFCAIRRVLKPDGRLHVYPASLPHPGAVELERLRSVLRETGLQCEQVRGFRMMHNKDMVDDQVYTFQHANIDDAEQAKSKSANASPMRNRCAFPL